MKIGRRGFLGGALAAATVAAVARAGPLEQGGGDSAFRTWRAGKNVVRGDLLQAPNHMVVGVATHPARFGDMVKVQVYGLFHK